MLVNGEGSSSATAAARGPVEEPAQAETSSAAVKEAIGEVQRRK